MSNRNLLADGLPPYQFVNSFPDIDMSDIQKPEEPIVLITIEDAVKRPYWMQELKFNLNKLELE